MGSKWNNGSRDIGGILRKTNQHVIADNEQRLGELLVFGYACKIFRDDEKARLIDQGKHLIPWMGDNSLKIDRYDVRAALPDLSIYEPPPGGYTNRMDYLTPAEQRAEQLCEEERYYSLYNNEEEQQLYQEEELKRLHREGAVAYGQVQFDYNSTSGVSESSKKENDETNEEPDEVFTPPRNFVIPASLNTPETMKEHAIIERTAKFISTQGPQMEILIKTKQSNNPQFEFLIQSNKLNPYYKFVLESFKNGTYPNQIKSESPEDQKNPLTQSNDSSSIVTQSETVNHNSNSTLQPVPHQTVFIHPTAVNIPKIKYKPSADCAYTQLISKIKGVPIPEHEETSNENDTTEFIEESAPSLYYSSYYASGTQLDHEQYYATEQQPLVATQQEAISPKEETPSVEVKKISSALMLAQCYASDTEDENDGDDIRISSIPQNVVPPPESLENIIEKTAIYVAKNGKQFEDILRTKHDERFLFLDPTNEYFPYYLHKVTSLDSSYVPSFNGHEKSKAMTPVSFSIKPKDDSSVPINPGLLQETSDDDDPESKAQSAANQQNQSSNVPAVPVTPSPKALIAAATAARISAAIAHANAAKKGSTSTSSRTRFDIDNTGTVVNQSTTGVTSTSSSSSSATSMSSLSGAINGNKAEVTHQKELKRAEEKVKDRLAQIAREKLGLISKEKQLQLERKKRAMAFLNQIKSTSGSSHPSSSPKDSTTPPLNNITNYTSKTNASDDSGSDSDVSSVHSIPISSYQNDDEDVVDEETENAAPNRERSKSIEFIKEEILSERKSHKIRNKKHIERNRGQLRNGMDTEDLTTSDRSSRKRDREDRERGDHDRRNQHHNRSRSRSKASSSKNHQKKSKKSKHSKKKSKKRSRTRSPSVQREKKRSKKSESMPTTLSSSSSSAKKSKKKKRKERSES